MTRYASLFTGAGGLDLGIEAAGFEPLWLCENDKQCRKVLAERFPGVHVHGDVALVEEDGDRGLDLLVGGFPCQDLSYAGKRAGLEGDRSGLWFEMARCVRLLEPRLVLVENVPGLMRPVAGGSGIAPIGVVLADLAELGYDARWGRLRAADVGAPHLRSRVFIIAWRRALADAGSLGRQGDVRRLHEGGRGIAAGAQVHAADTSSGGGARDAGAAPRTQEEGGRLRADDSDLARDPRQDAADPDGLGRSLGGEPQSAGLEGEARSEPDGHLPHGRLDDEPSLADPDDPGRPQQLGTVAAGSQHGATQRGGGEAPALADDPCERARQGGRGALHGSQVAELEALESGGCDRGGEGGIAVDWGIFRPAIERWERLTRPAPRPTDDRGRLNPRFSEWMLGYPEGWCDVAKVSRTSQLRMLGNSCQVQVAEAIGFHLRDVLEELE